ncbi:MAG: Hsp20 family protein [Pyrinomonadaceae bacterium]
MNKAKETTAVATVEKKQETSPVFIETEKMFDKLSELTREIAQNAYEYFRKRGGEFGKELDDWFNAEAKVLRPVAVEITETDGTIDVSAAVPGFKPKEIEISVEDNQLILSGKTEKRKEREDENVVYTDWESNRFFRQLTLPSAVDTDNVEAELKDGILRLSLTKASTDEPKRIAVKAG